jgi:predicted nuclease of predicted toxin-antitoxin system
LRLLLDQNLSHRLKGPLASVYPEVAHVRDFSLERADDTAVVEEFEYWMAGK